MRNQDGIYRRPDSPFWWASWTDGSGKAARRSTGIRVSDDPRGREARRARAAMMSGRAAEAAGPEPQARTWDELVEAYMDGPGSAKSPRSMERDRHSLRALYRRFSGAPLDAINGAAVRAYIAARREDGMSDASVRSECALMGAISAWGARELEWPVPNPWAGRLPRPSPPRDRWLTRDEGDRLIESAYALAALGRWPWIGDFVRLCLFTGLRRAEALGLEWSRVDLDAGAIRFGAGDQKSGRAGSIPLNRSARLALANRPRSGARVFEGVRHPDAAFAAAVRGAGLANVRIHDLRRTFGSWLAQEGVPIQRISLLMRHSTIGITHSTYAHLSPAELAEAAGALDRTPRLRVAG